MFLPKQSNKKQHNGYDGQQGAAGRESQSPAEEELAADVYDCIRGARYVEASESLLTEASLSSYYYLIAVYSNAVLCISWFG